MATSQNKKHGTTKSHKKNHHDKNGFHLLLKTSEQGLNFIYSIEVGPLEETTSHLHWPGGSSGVTLGPGYDMKLRKKVDVLKTLMEVGLSRQVAEQASNGVTLTNKTNPKAEDFADDNEELIALTKEQQLKLLSLIVPHYEGIVIRNIHVPLKQYEFDALVCFVYNPGGSFVPIAHTINAGHMEQAVELMRRRVITGGKTSKGLERRRQRETWLLQTGHY